MKKAVHAMFAALGASCCLWGYDANFWQAAGLGALAASASPVDELMPEPRRVAASGGVADAAAVANVTVRTADVPGAPAGVADEAYVLDVTARGVTITARGRLGERHARTTLDQLVRLSGGAVPCCTVTDWPRLRWRGFMLDTGRNFMDVASLKDLIDVMARYKLNLFHWHLTEYYAWRLASKRYPEMEKKAYYDPFGHRHRGKFYSQDDFREIVGYAAARGVTVMPELDIPGHSQAFREAFGFRTMRDAGVEETLANLIDELCKLAPKEVMPFVHLGGDEVWDEPEKVEKRTMTRWAKVVADNGRTLVTWNPGQDFDPQGPRVAMLWGRQKSADCPQFDARGWYIEDYNPFEIVNAAAFAQPFGGAAPEERQWGAIFCSWHDAAVGLPYARAFRNVAVFPACVMLGDLYWHGRACRREFARRRLPLAGDPLLETVREIERRTVAQRDRALTDLRHPFPFVRQTQMRWRLTDRDGRLIAKDIAQGSVYPYDGPESPRNLYHSTTGVVFMETWVRSPSDRTVGAWIGFTDYDRDQGRYRARGTPSRGQWNRYGATVEVNGEAIPPPVWEQPDLEPGQQTPMVRYDHAIDEIPFTNDEWYMREPTPIRLKAGWNHVKLTLPMTHRVNTWMTQRWVGTFMPVAGTTDRPREVDDLEYSADPPTGDGS